MEFDYNCHNHSFLYQTKSVQMATIDTVALHFQNLIILYFLKQFLHTITAADETNPTVEILLILSFSPMLHYTLCGNFI